MTALHKATAIGMALVLLSLFLCPDGAGQVIYTCAMDHCTRPVPPAWEYDQVGGARGVFGTAAFSQAGPSTYDGAIHQYTGAWGYLGMWYSLGRTTVDKPAYDPEALFHPVIKTNYQARLLGVDLVVSSFELPAGRADMLLRLEVKGFNASSQEVAWASRTWSGREAVTNGGFPKTYSFEIDPAQVPNVGVIAWVLDRGVTGDVMEVDAVHLRVEMPRLETWREAYLISLAMLLDQVDGNSGMVQDRSYWARGQMEGITATAKLGKLLAIGMELDMLDEDLARAIITKIANTFVNVIPRGPPGVNQLLAHFTTNGGTQRRAGSEWASGDTVYAVLDLITALQMIGDPQDQLADVFAILEAIDWEALESEDGYFSYGYGENGALFTGLYLTWRGFGMETFAVMLAALAADGILDETYWWLPTGNGSGFITHAPYGIIPEGTDRWGNVWSEKREAECDIQLNWYLSSGNRNTNLVDLGLFGLSACEDPAGTAYKAYGTGGWIRGPDDATNRVVVPHYCGLIAPLRYSACTQMWEQLKSKGWYSPLNNVESLAINPTNGTVENVNYFQGSWNLALQAEGWALTDTNVQKAVSDAFLSVPALSNAFETLMTARHADLTLSAFPGRHGVPHPMDYGTQTVVWGQILTNTVETPADTANNTRYICTGWTFEGGGSAYSGESSSVTFRLWDDFELQWHWWPEHYLELSAPNGGITGAAEGWRTQGYYYDLVPTGAPGYVFDHWETNGANAGTLIPLALEIDEPKAVTAVFVTAHADMVAFCDLTFTGWELHEAPDSWLATVEVCNAGDSPKIMTEPFWFGVEETASIWLGDADGTAPDGREYVDVTAAVLDQLEDIGDADEELDPGECVTVSNILVISMNGDVPTGIFWATWANPPTNSLTDPARQDTDRDGMPNAWEDQYAVLDKNWPLDRHADPDGDRARNFDEYQADTDPEDEESYLRFAGWNRTNGVAYMTWAGGVLATQYIERSSDQTTWDAFLTNAPPTGRTNRMGVTIGTSPREFWRVRVGR